MMLEVAGIADSRSSLVKKRATTLVSYKSERRIINQLQSGKFTFGTLNLLNGGPSPRHLTMTKLPEAMEVCIRVCHLTA